VKSWLFFAQTYSLASRFLIAWYGLNQLGHIPVICHLSVESWRVSVCPSAGGTGYLRLWLIKVVRNNH